MREQWKTVPIEPTQKMKDAADADHTYFGHIATNKYKVMIEAAPQAPSAPALLEARGLIEAAALDHAPDANLDRAAELLTAFVAAQPTGAMDEREVIQAAKLLFNLTIADPTLKVRAPSAEKRDAITAAADAFRAAIAAAAVGPSGISGELAAAAPALLAEVERQYVELADYRNSWAGRNTIAGQMKLCQLRDLIAKATGRTEHDVQDDYGTRAAIAASKEGASHGDQG